MTPGEFKNIEMGAWGSNWQMQFEALSEHIQSQEAELNLLRAFLGNSDEKLLSEANKIRDERIKAPSDGLQMKLPGV